MFTLSARKSLLLFLLCAIVFLSSGYLIGRYRRHTVSPPPQTEAIHLNRYYHFTELMRDPAIECELTRYKSNYDQSEQSTFIMRPAGRKSERLFFFFHGMDGDCGDAVVVHDLVKRLNATVISVGGRGPAWVSDAFIADAEQVIRSRTRQKDITGYYLIGISMGGTQALALAGLLPDDLRASVQGVVALIPGSNLVAISASSSSEDVKRTLRASVGGNNALLEQRSPLQLLDRYKPDLPFAIFYDQQDTLLLTSELEKFVAALRSNHHPVTTFATSGNHSFAFSDFDYQEVVQSLGSNSIENKVPLLSN